MVGELLVFLIISLMITNTHIFIQLVIALIAINQGNTQTGDHLNTSASIQQRLPQS